MQLLKTQLRATNARVAAVTKNWFHDNIPSFLTEISGLTHSVAIDLAEEVEAFVCLSNIV
jgi:hypothetical protein